MKSKLKTALNIILGFVLGSFVTIMFWISSLNDEHVPGGIWSPLAMVQGASYQVNLTSAEIADDDIATVWIREDRQTLFTGESSLQGKTMISRVRVDCKNKNVELLEQRAFGD